MQSSIYICFLRATDCNYQELTDKSEFSERVFVLEKFDKMCNTVKLSKSNTLTTVDGFSYRHELLNFISLSFCLLFN